MRKWSELMVVFLQHFLLALGVELLLNFVVLISYFKLVVNANITTFVSSSRLRQN